jgi:hypothetical protein
MGVAAEGGTRLIPLTKGHFAIVDACEYGALSQFRWHAQVKSNTVYARRDIRISKTNTLAIFMHHDVVGKPQGLLVDHINGNGLDNRRSNLRLCSFTKNMQNRRSVRNSRSRFKGAYWHKNKKTWTSVITCYGKRHDLGDFASEANAAQAYNFAAHIYMGEFARSNNA